MQTQTFKTLTIKIPQIHFQVVLKKFIASVSQTFFAFVSFARSHLSVISSRTSIARRLPQLPPRLRNLNLKKVLPIAIVLVAAGLTIFAVSRYLSKPRSGITSDGRVIVAGAKASATLSQDFSFPLIDSKGNNITDIKFVLDSAELRDEIIVKGKRATAIQGRTFLILTVKITNNFTKALEINSKDYFRLITNGKDNDLLAPDIHNDPVVVQPTSTKFTRIGWPINDTDKNIVLMVGEIEGDKTKVELNLQ